MFREVWQQDPANPEWDSTKVFPTGSVILKVLFTDATNEELPFKEVLNVERCEFMFRP